MSAWTLTARWLLPVAAPPLPGGTLTIEGERIVAVESHGVRRADLDFGDCAILPGLVNAHIHLDLTGMRGLAPPTPNFTAWLRQVITHRRARNPAAVQDDIRAGLAEAIRTGTTLLGDISGNGGSWETLAAAPLRAVVFRELLGLPADRAEQAAKEARAWLESHPATRTCRAGLSPHAPYSVRTDLFRKAALLAREHQAPLAVHLAETREELDLLHRRGPFVEFLQEVGVWDPDGLADSPETVMALCDTGVPTVFVHCNHLSPSARIPINGSIVYCPRTHAAFGHPPHPFREFLAKGVRIALGTDGLSSNPDLDLLAEARFLHERHPDVPGEVVLRMATLWGAEALSWADETGSLEVGKSGDLVVVPLSDVGGDDPHRLLLDSDAPVARVLCRGQWVFPGSGGETSVHVRG
jgi:cytosine/adenosine deaminase-related metal-dependent hydrolase